MDKTVVQTIDGILEEYVAKGDSLRVTQKQDVTEFVKFANEAQAGYNEPGNGVFTNNNGLYHAARIPVNVVEGWKAKYGFDWFTAPEAEKKKWLNSEHCRPWRLQRTKV